MTNNNAAAAAADTLRDAAGTLVSDTLASRDAAAAAAAYAVLTAGIAASERAGARVLTTKFGPDADATSVRWAHDLTAIMSGEVKRPTQGGRATRTAAMIKVLEERRVMSATLTVADFVTAARTVLDARNAEKRAKSEAAKVEREAAAAQRAAIKSVMNDSSAPKSHRVAAAAALADFDAEQNDARDVAKLARLRSALESARMAGFSIEQVDALVRDVFAPLTATEVA